jgi:DNA-binding NtrC family response regulator
MIVAGELDVLYVEDDACIRDAVALGIEVEFGSVRTAEDGVEALAMIRSHRPDVVVTDIRMPRMDGLQLMARLKTEFPDLPVIITTAFTEVEYLLRAIELGVSACIRKPITYPLLRDAIRSAGQPALLKRQIRQMKARADEMLLLKFGFSPLMRAVAEQAVHAADSDFMLTVQGECGVGKVHLARQIHVMSVRRLRPFTVLPCHGVPAERLERELFGMKRWGTGKLAAASDGVVVLQHFDALPRELQIRLLRAVEENSFLPSGETRPLALDVRLITTISGSVRQALVDGRLDPALAYVLADQTIEVPPLRRIREEIPRLASTFLAEAVDNLHRHDPRLTEEAGAFLSGQPWSGNMRELRSVMRRAAISGQTMVSVEVLKLTMTGSSTGASADIAAPPPSTLTLDELERWALLNSLKQSDGKKMQAAVLLGLDYKRFKRKLEKYGLTLPE